MGCSGCGRFEKIIEVAESKNLFKAKNFKEI